MFLNMFLNKEVKIKMLKKIILLVTLFTLILTTIGASISFGADNVKITLVGFEVGSYYVDEFREKTGIEVEVTTIPYKDRHQKIVVSFMGGNPYDLIVGSNTWTPEFAMAGWLEPLNNRITSDMREQNFESTWKVSEIGGQYYSIPWVFNIDSFMYNEQILGKAGITHPPSTWDEFIQQARKIKELGIVEYPLAWTWSESNMAPAYFLMVRNFGGEFFDKQGNPVFNDEAGVEALEFMKKLYQEGLINPTALTQGFDSVANQMYAGQAAFMINGIKHYQLVNDPTISRVAGHCMLGLMPGIKGKTTGGQTLLNTGDLSIAADSLHKDEAWEYIKFFTSKEIEKKLYLLSKTSGSCKSLYETQEFKETFRPATVKSGDPASIFIKQVERAEAMPTGPWSAEFTTKLTNQIHAAIMGQKSCKEALDTLAKEFEQLKKIYQ